MVVGIYAFVLLALVATIGTVAGDPSVTEQIIDEQKDKQDQKSTEVLRGPRCTPDYSFTYIRPESSMTFNSHIKKRKGSRLRYCGLWFWTTSGYNLELECKSIDIGHKNAMILYDIDNNVMIRKTMGKYANEMMTFKTNNLAVGMEIKRKRKKLSYSCKISAVQPMYATVVIGGDTNGGNTDTVTKFEAGIAIPLSAVPAPVCGSSVSFHNNTLYSCGGESNLVNTDACFSLDLLASNVPWMPFSTLPETFSKNTMMTVNNGLWIVKDTKVFVVPFDGSPTQDYDLPTGLNVPSESCGGGSKQYRFVIPYSESYVWINSDAQDPENWEMLMDMDLSGTKNVGCLIIEDTIFVTGGLKVPVVSKQALYVNIKEEKKYYLADLLEGRMEHTMGVVDQRIAVIGGEVFNSRVDTIHTFNRHLNVWEVSTSVIMAPTSKISSATFEIY